MAVPFAMPENNINDLIRVVILILSQSLQESEEENIQLFDCMEELIRLLIEESERRSHMAASNDTQLRQALILVNQAMCAFDCPTNTNTLTPAIATNTNTVDSRRRHHHHHSRKEPHSGGKRHSQDPDANRNTQSHMEYNENTINPATNSISTTIISNVTNNLSDSSISNSAAPLDDDNEFEDTSIWTLVAEPVRWSFWTAMPIICVVGWHFFQNSCI